MLAGLIASLGASASRVRSGTNLAKQLERGVCAWNREQRGLCRILGCNLREKSFPGFFRGAKPVRVSTGVFTTCQE